MRVFTLEMVNYLLLRDTNKAYQFVRHSNIHQFEGKPISPEDVWLITLSKRSPSLRNGIILVEYLQIRV